MVFIYLRHVDCRASVLKAGLLKAGLLKAGLLKAGLLKASVLKLDGQRYVMPLVHTLFSLLL